MTPSSPDHAPVDVTGGDLTVLLGAFQHLQMQNIRVTAHLSDELGLGPTDLRVLLFLFRAEDASPKDVAGLLGHTTGSVTVQIDRLEKSGHLERRRHPTDRRSQTLHLTDLGVTAVHQMRDLYQGAFDGVFTGPALQTAAKNLRALGDALAPYASGEEDSAG